MKYTILAIILGVAVLLGVFFLVKSNDDTATTPTPAPVTNTTKSTTGDKQTTNPTPAPAAQPTGQSAAPASKISKAELTTLFAASPVAGATNDEYQAYFKRVLQAAVSSTTLDVTACAPTPNLIHFKEKQSITFQNRDSVQHVLSTGGPKNTIIATIPANSTKDIVPVTGQGLIGYACDGAGPVGGMFVD